MSLTEQTSQELEELARTMTSEGVNIKSYRNFGTLVRMNSDEFRKFENEIVLGEVEVNDEKFIYFNK